MVWRAEGTRPHQSAGRIEDSGHAVNLGGFQGLVKCQRRKDGGHAFGKHGLARARRTNHQQVVPTGGGDLDGPFGRLLPPHIAEVHPKLLRSLQQCVGVNLDRLEAVAGIQELDHFDQRVHRVNINAIHQGGLARIDLGNDKPADFVCPRGYGNGQRSPDASHSAVERQLAHK